MKFELNNAILYFIMKRKEAEEKERKFLRENSFDDEIPEELLYTPEEVMRLINNEKNWNTQMIEWLQELKAYREGAN